MTLFLRCHIPPMIIEEVNKESNKGTRKEYEIVKYTCVGYSNASCYSTFQPSFELDTLKKSTTRSWKYKYLEEMGKRKEWSAKICR